jgi:hypothetical protein
MTDDAREALIPSSDWKVNVYALTEQDRNPAGFRPISVKYVGNNTAGQAFCLTFVKNAGALQATSTLVIDKTAQQLIDMVTAAGKTSKPLRCIALESYLAPNGTHKYSTVFIENTGVHAKAWFWWFNKSWDFIKGEIDQSRTGDPYPLRLIHIGPNQQPVGQPYNYDGVAIRNVGADKQWHWVHPDLALDGIGPLIAKHADHKARIYQLACTKNPVTDSYPWSVILVDGTAEGGFFDKALGQYNDPTVILNLAQQRDARVLDLVSNGLGNPPGQFAVPMLKCQ